MIDEQLEQPDQPEQDWLETMHREKAAIAQKELHESWIKALRSGKYKQGRRQLRSGDKYCCMGVLCDISGFGKWENRSDIDAIGNDNYSYVVDVYVGGDKVEEKQRESFYIPDIVATLAGIAPRGRGLSSNEKSLTYMNDFLELSFMEIADWLEGKLPKDYFDE